MELVYSYPWEVSLIVWFQYLINSFNFLLPFFVAITQLGEPIMAVLIFGFFYWAYDKKVGVLVALHSIFGEISNTLIKNLFVRVRPYAAHEEIECLNVVEPGYDIYDMTKQGYSFPSGHCTCVTAYTMAIANYFRNKAFYLISLVLICLVGVSRFVLGVHYPIDCVVGIILGFIVALFISVLYRKLEKKYVYLVLWIISVIGVFYCTSNDYYSTLGLLFGFTLGDLFEERFVKFTNTRNIIKSIIRTVAGGGIFLLISIVMKLPFSKETLEAADTFAYLYRSFRYFVASFVVIAIYPYLFRSNILKLDDKMEVQHAD